MPPKKKTTTPLGQEQSAQLYFERRVLPCPHERHDELPLPVLRNVGVEGAESGDRAALLGPSGNDEASEKACQICPICALVILESTNDVEGHEALLCEGSCNQWYYRWCVGVSKACYEAPL